MADELSIDIERRYGGGREVTAGFTAPAHGSEVTVLFGPSGSGKTTVLRCIAGLERPDAGRVVWRGEVWSDAESAVWVPPQRRRVGLVPQQQALFPRRTVAGNIGFGLRRLPRHRRSERVGEMLDTFGLRDMAGRRPAELSVGQQQRVALARAVAPGPRVLLLDEPFSALDAPARKVLGRELRGLLAAAGVPSIVVTHDRSEALAIGDRMVVLIDGRVRQVDSVERVFSRPADEQVAAAVEVENVLPGRLAGRADGVVVVEVAGRRLTAVDNDCRAENVFACVRAEEIALRLLDIGPPDSARNHLEGAVIDLSREGPGFRVRIDCGFELAALVTPQAKAELELAPGTPVVAIVKATSIHCIDR